VAITFALPCQSQNTCSVIEIYEHVLSVVAGLPLTFINIITSTMIRTPATSDRAIVATMNAFHSSLTTVTHTQTHTFTHLVVCACCCDNTDTTYKWGILSLPPSSLSSFLHIRQHKITAKNQLYQIYMYGPAVVILVSCFLQAFITMFYTFTFTVLLLMRIRYQSFRICEQKYTCVAYAMSAYDSAYIIKIK